MTVNPKVFGSERTDEPQMLEIERSLLHLVHIVTHSVTTTSDAPCFVFNRHKGKAVPTTSRWVSVKRDVTGGNTCPQVLTKRLKVETQHTKPQQNKKTHVLICKRNSGTNRFVTGFGLKASAVRRAEMFSVCDSVGLWCGRVLF